MATGPPIGPGSSLPPPRAPSPSSMPMTWEGDKMFNIYIYDYCNKRGFWKTARELLDEADIPPDSAPPIDARQGLLFEWWSVFWILFAAKISGNGTEEAMLYTQHQANQAAQRQQVQHQAVHRMQGQPPMTRYMNGAMPRQPGLMSNGSMPNGVGPSPLPPGPIQPGGQVPATFQMGAPGPQTNGMPGPPGAPPAPVASAPPPPSNLHNLVPNQRPPLGPQQRGPNGIGPFSSPPIAPSPQNTAGPGQLQHSQPPMGQLGPSPHLTHMNRGSMLPPNGPQGLNNQGGIGQQVNPPTPNFQPMGRPPSRTATPGKNNMMALASPSLASRQPPNSNYDRQGENLNAEIGRLSHSLLAQVKQEAGLGDKEFPSWSFDDKQRVLALVKQRKSASNNAAAGPSGSNPSMQPPNQRNQLQQQQQQPQQRLKRNSTSPGEQHGDLPRNESSPPDRKRVRRSPIGLEQASLTTMSPFPHPPPQQGGPGSQQQQPQPQQMPNGMMRGPMGGPPMNGFPQPPGMPNMGNSPGMNIQMTQMGIPQMGNAMSPGMAHQGSGGMMTPQMSQMMHNTQYRQSMQHLHKGGGMGNPLPGSAGSPASSEQLFNPNISQGLGAPFPSGSRTNQNRSMSMLPPPSPALNAPPKDQNGPTKDNKNGNSTPSNGLPEGSPRNPPNSSQGQGHGQGQGQGQGQGPGQGPGPGPAQGQGQSQGAQSSGNPGQGSNAPPTPVPGPNQNMPGSVTTSLLGNPPVNQLGQPTMTSDLFSTDFIQSVASTLDDLVDPLFRQDGDINFERDFGQWFNPNDIDSMEMK